MITPDVSLGNIIEVVGFLGTIFISLGATKARLADFTKELSEVKTSMKDLSKVVIDQARQEEKMLQVEKRLNNIDTRLNMVRQVINKSE